MPSELEEHSKVGKLRKKPGPRPKPQELNLELQKDSDAQGKHGQAPGYQNDAFKKDQIRLAQNCPVISPDKDYQTKLFHDIDPNKFKLYDKYQKLLDSLIHHPELAQHISQHKEQPIFLRIPDASFDRQESMSLENEGEGYLNFQMIQHRLRNKKYGPGRNIMKEGMILLNIRNVFRICEKYFPQDEPSVRLSRILEKHFENELSVSPNLKAQAFRIPKKGAELAEEEKQMKNKPANNLKGDDRNHLDNKRSNSKDHYEVNENGFEGQMDPAAGHSVSSKKKKDKKDKKKDKKDKKKKKDHKDQKQASHRDKEQKSSQQQKARTENHSEEDGDSHYEVKQQLFEVITTKLTIEQKKGIIPIVFQDDSGNKKQKFEFDLFSLEPHVFKKLEEYVQSCVNLNDKEAGAEEQNTEMK